MVVEVQLVMMVVEMERSLEDWKGYDDGGGGGDKNEVQVSNRCLQNFCSSPPEVTVVIRIVVDQFLYLFPQPSHIHRLINCECGYA